MICFSQFCKNEVFGPPPPLPQLCKTKMTCFQVYVLRNNCLLGEPVIFGIN
jgi:hypothetical protein